MTRAVVIGGGPVGLTTAMLLAADGFEVTVLDRDDPAPESVDDAWGVWERRSVGQFRQVHYLQPRARHIMEERLPRVLDELKARGAVKFNMIEAMARCIPGGPGELDFSPFDTYTTCRRPVIESAFAAAARAVPNLEIRNRVIAAGLETGPEVVPGVPHVVGVRTDDGEVFAGDVVVDAAGRRTPVPAMIEAAGGRRPEEHSVEVGFTYNTMYFRGDALPEVRGDLLANLGSISLLTMPGDDGYWSTTLYHSPADKPMRKVRDPEVFRRVLAALPQHAQWGEGDPVSGVLTMASTANATREFVADGTPAATGIVPVGDAWGFTNPSLGRGIALGMIHAVGVAAAVRDHAGDPVALARAWSEVTAAEAVPWHDTTVQFDVARGPEVEALRQGKEFEPGDDVMSAMARAFDSARQHDVEVLHSFGRIGTCLSLPGEVVGQPGLLERVLAVSAEHEPHRTPAPTRTELEALLG